MNSKKQGILSLKGVIVHKFLNSIGAVEDLKKMTIFLLEYISMALKDSEQTLPCSA